MKAINDGGPAFPVSLGGPEGHQDSMGTWQHPGMSKRDHFAARAMQGMLSGHISHYGHDNHWPWKSLASEAVDMADALVAEIARRQA